MRDFQMWKLARSSLTKTVEQIKYKRKMIKASSEASGSQEVAQEAEGECDPVSPGNAPARNIEELERDSISEWRRCLLEQIEKTSDVPLLTQKIFNECV
jgi:hypothetical protein